jgi:nucleoprotein TPR
MLQEEISMQSREIDNLRKRNQKLDDQFIRADIACSHATEDLVEAKRQMEHLRNECANLRAEKKIWEVNSALLLCDNSLLTLPWSYRACKFASLTRIRCWPSNVHIYQTSWAMYRRCTTTWNDLAKMIDVV